MKYRWLIIDEDGTPRGTNNQECAEAIANSNCACFVLDLQSMELKFEGRNLGEIKEQPYNPEDWE